MHRPFMHYPKAGNDDSGARIMEILKAHRNNRGFQMNPEDAYMRRPRTTFFTPDTAHEAAIADHCWKLPTQVGGECINDKPAIAWPTTAGDPDSPPPQKKREQARELDAARAEEARRELLASSNRPPPSSQVPALPGSDMIKPPSAISKAIEDERERKKVSDS